jgi:hypothetical protein
MKRVSLKLSNRITRPFFAFFVFLAASATARAIAIFPASVQNNTSVTVEICVVRVQTRLGSPAATNEVKVTIQPGQRASVMLMSGSFGNGASFTKQITISEVATPGVQPAVKTIALSLDLNNLDNPVSTMAREFIVDIDPKTKQFTFEAVPIKPLEKKEEN